MSIPARWWKCQDGLPRTYGREGGTILYHVHLDTFILFSSSVNFEDNHTSAMQVTNALHKLKFQ